MVLYLEIVSVYIIFISLVSAIVCVYDKHQAIVSGRRISERNLFLLSALGGSIAMYFTMRIIRHKTRHNRFMIGLPALIIIQIVVFTYIGANFF